MIILLDDAGWGSQLSEGADSVGVLEQHPRRLNGGFRWWTILDSNQ